MGMEIRVGYYFLISIPKTMEQTSGSDSTVYTGFQTEQIKLHLDLKY